MEILNFKLEGKVEEYYLFSYKVDNRNEMTRIKPINDGKNYELTIGFGDFRTKMIIDVNSKMGKDIDNAIKSTQN